MITTLWKQLEAQLIRSWWVVFFCLLCYAGYEQSMSRYQRKMQHYQAQRDELLAYKQDLLDLQADLTLQINSQSDPLWIERTLMGQMGLVPEGQIKIVFDGEE